MDIHDLSRMPVGAESLRPEAARPRTWFESLVEGFGAYTSSEQAHDVAMARANAGYPAPTPQREVAPPAPTPPSMLGTMDPKIFLVIALVVAVVMMRR